MLWRADPDRANCRLESCVRENRTHSSEGGEDVSPSRPLSTSAIGATRCCSIVLQNLWLGGQAKTGKIELCADLIKGGLQ
jgi:hypothetical protein